MRELIHGENNSAVIWPDCVWWFWLSDISCKYICSHLLLLFGTDRRNIMFCSQCLSPTPSKWIHVFLYTFNYPYSDLAIFCPLFSFIFMGSDPSSKEAKKLPELVHQSVCDNSPRLFFRRTMSFLKRQDQRMLVLNQLLVSVCARSVHSGISINLIRGQLETSQNSRDSTENSLQIDNNSLLFIHS